MSESPEPRPPADRILDEVRRFYEEHHEGIEASRGRHRYYYDYLTRILRVRVPEQGRKYFPPADRILDEVRRFYEEHHEGIEASRRTAPLLLRLP